jgi:hypothetical protein
VKYEKQTFKTQRKANKLGLQANKDNKLEEDMHARFKKQTRTFFDPRRSEKE